MNVRPYVWVPALNADMPVREHLDGKTRTRNRVLVYGTAIPLIILGSLFLSVGQGGAGVPCLVFGLFELLAWFCAWVIIFSGDIIRAKRSAIGKEQVNEWKALRHFEKLYNRPEYSYEDESAMDTAVTAASRALLRNDADALRSAYNAATALDELVTPNAAAIPDPLSTIKNRVRVVRDQQRTQQAVKAHDVGERVKRATSAAMVFDPVAMLNVPNYVRENMTASDDQMATMLLQSGDTPSDVARWLTGVVDTRMAKNNDTPKTRVRMPGRPVL